MNVPEIQLQKLNEYFLTGTPLSFNKGETIVRPEDPPGGIFFIKSGFVKALALTKYGEENVLLIRKQGEKFPLIWAFTGLHRDVSYLAMEETSLLRIGKSDYLEFLQKNPDTLPVVLNEVIEAYRLHSERVITLSYRTVRERVVSFLLTSKERFGRDIDSGSLIDAPIRQYDIACSINAARETASRELSYLAKKGWIKLNSEHAIIIVDEAKLRALL